MTEIEKRSMKNDEKEQVSSLWLTYCLGKTNIKIELLNSNLG